MQNLIVVFILPIPPGIRLIVFFSTLLIDLKDFELFFFALEKQNFR